jgi:hypothetical protein
VVASAGVAETNGKQATATIIVNKNTLFRITKKSFAGSISHGNHKYGMMAGGIGLWANTLKERFVCLVIKHLQ